MRHQYSNISNGLWQSVLQIVDVGVRRPKLGRNQPCLCGSGKKYKLCCLDKQGKSTGLIDLDRLLSKNGELAFVPQMVSGYYSREENDAIVKHVLKSENVFIKTQDLAPDEIALLRQGNLSDCELLALIDYYSRTVKKNEMLELLAQVAKSNEIDPYVGYFGVFEELINHWRNKDTDRAIDFLRQRMRKIPCDDESDPDMDERDLADLYITKGDTENGMRMFEDLIERSPDNIWNYNCAALSLLGTDEYQLAERFIVRGIDVATSSGDPEDLLPQFNDMLKEVRRKGKFTRKLSCKSVKNQNIIILWMKKIWQRS